MRSIATASRCGAALFMCHLKDPSFGWIDQICRFAFASENTARAFDNRNQCLQTKFSVVSYFDDAECRSARSSGIQKLLLTRKIDVVQTGTGNDRIDYSSIMRDIETYNMIAAGDEEKGLWSAVTLSPLSSAAIIAAFTSSSNRTVSPITIASVCAPLCAARKSG